MRDDKQAVLPDGEAEPAGSADTDGATRKIDVAELTKEFETADGRFTALDRLSFQVDKGQFFMVVGPSGCGKSTLLRILAGLERPTSGTVRAAPGPRDKPSNSMVFQQESIFPWMNVWDNAAYGLRMRGVPKPQIRAVVDAYLDKTGLSRFARAYPHQLSGGMKQRVALARAFANDPDILLMDEPFSSLDEQNKTLLQEELLRIWEDSAKTVLFITHSVDEAVTLGDKILLMTAQPGRIKKLIDVPFERPREVLELRARPEYGELVYQIWESLREEVDLARQKEDESP